MADKLELTDFGSKLLYGTFSGEPVAIVSFVLGTSNEPFDRKENGAKAPVYRGQVSAITYVDVSSMIVHLQVGGDAKAIDGSDLPTGTEFKELVLYTEDKNPFAVAQLDTPIRFERGSRVTPIQLPVALERPASRVIDTLTISEHAMLPGTRLQDLPAPHDSQANALIVNDLFYAGLERPTLAFKYGVAAHRWTFSDHLLAREAVRAGAVLRVGCALEGLELGSEWHRLHTTAGVMETRHVVAADGARGPTARWAGWSESRRRRRAWSTSRPRRLSRPRVRLVATRPMMTSTTITSIRVKPRLARGARWGIRGSRSRCRRRSLRRRRCRRRRSSSRPPRP